ncbi:hypothetical protein I7I50_06193 [Histoplasma capsulatum G186AR]|uniref:Uncharacterized protein n=1 Tax=Ajellomyces capsulatus TaxID=5037 RepID=A0A8H8D454_AJECA|nr:hypothetical protein I7I52_10729 [Histoplasma capsulatum]QSS67187.1 hypothetical protein I7I50_06193 [Histoplasma capsulatum G186AR]
MRRLPRCLSPVTSVDRGELLPCWVFALFIFLCHSHLCGVFAALSRWNSWSFRLPETPTTKTGTGQAPTRYKPK